MIIKILTLNTIKSFNVSNNSIFIKKGPGYDILRPLFFLTLSQKGDSLCLRKYTRKYDYPFR